MRVEGMGRVESTPSVKRKKLQGASSFDAVLAQEEENNGNTLPSLIEGPSFLALQEVRTSAISHHPLFHRAETLLTSLEALVEDMLLAKDSTDHQEDIKTLLQKARATLSDHSELTPILEEIEIRALVELAKLGQ